MREIRTGRTRTEHDLRDALAALERYAPDPDTMLRAVRDAAAPRRTGPARRASWLRRPQLIVPIAVAVAAAALVIALLPGAGSPGSGQVQRAETPGLPTATSVAKAMLTAFNAASDDVAYVTQTGIVRGLTTDVYRSWSWPAQPAPGQRQTDRTVYSGSSPESAAVKLTEDLQAVFVTPPVNVAPYGQITMVCYRDSGQTGCGYGKRDTPPGGWSRFSAPIAVANDIGAGGIFNPVVLARGIAGGAWRVVRRTRLDGQQAIELDETGQGGDVIEPMPTLLWINAQTYLPIRLVSGTPSSGSTIDFRYLPPSAANLALLRLPIPAGYSRYIPKG